MKKDSFAIKILLLSIMLPPPAALYADDGSDCSSVIPEFGDTALLTREERIRMMDQALEDALGRVQDCRQKPADMGEGDTIPGSAATDLSGSGASADIAVHESDAKAGQAKIDDTGSELNTTENMRVARPDNELSGAETSAQQRTGSMPAGKLPEDIPPADNDNIIARQIREAASAEPDPEKQAKLWNEYRRYKGLPER